MAGYSGTPLAGKLGIKPGGRVYLAFAPGGYRTLLDPLPDGVSFERRLSRTADVIHAFFTRRAALEKSLQTMRRQMRSDASLWVSWPKKASGLATDLAEDVVREVALPLGLVDVKVCAVDDVWSGLKLVVRKELR